MTVTQDRDCPKCGRKVKMTRCEVCKGNGYTVSFGNKLLDNNGCNRHGWLCPTHGKNY